MCVCVLCINAHLERERGGVVFQTVGSAEPGEHLINNPEWSAASRNKTSNLKGDERTNTNDRRPKDHFLDDFFPPFRFPSSLMPFLPRFYSFHDALGFRCIRGLSFSYLSIVPLSVSVSFSVSLGKEKPIPFVSRPTSWLFDFDFQLIIKQTAPSPLTWKLKRPIPCATWSIDMKTGTGYYDNKKSRLLCLFSSFKVESK